MPDAYRETTLPGHVLSRWGTMDTHFNSHWRPHLEELQRWFNPRRGEFWMSDRGKPKPENRFLNETALLARRTAAAGMVSGASSPARPWIKLGILDPFGQPSSPMQDWLSMGEKFVLTVMGRSNMYRSYHQSYDEMLWAGTGPILLQQDFQTLLRSYQLTAGSWRVALGPDLRVDTLFFQQPWTLGNLVKQFGISNVSTHVANNYKKNQDDIVNVITAIEPNDDEFGNGAHALFPWRVVYVEHDESNSDPKPLAVEGRLEIPFVAPRWFTIGREAMGGSPAMDVLGTVRNLDVKEWDRNRILARVADPTMLKPTGMGDQKFAPRSVIEASPDQLKQISPAYVPTLAGYEQLVNETMINEERIRHGMYSDLFMLFFNLNRPQMTATEVTERASERMLALGPVLEGLDEELFDPTVRWILNTGIRTGAIPPPPSLPGEEAPVKVEYDSVLAQAQKAVGIGNIERFLALVGAAAELVPATIDKLDADALVDDYADRLRIDPRSVRGDDEVAPLRRARAEAEARQAMAAQLEAGASAAQKFANAPMGQGSVLDEVIRGTGALA